VSGEDERALWGCHVDDVGEIGSEPVDGQLGLAGLRVAVSPLVVADDPHTVGGQLAGLETPHVCGHQHSVGEDHGDVGSR